MNAKVKRTRRVGVVIAGVFAVNVIFSPLLADLGNDNPPDPLRIPGCRIGEGYPPASGYLQFYVSTATSPGPEGSDFIRLLPFIIAVWKLENGNVIVEGHRSPKDPEGAERQWVNFVVRRLEEGGINKNAINYVFRGAEDALIDDDELENNATLNRRIIIRIPNWGSRCRLLFRMEREEWIRSGGGTVLE